jgi:hypothetical protein
VPTLGELREALFPGVPLAAGTSDGPDRRVGWVRVLRARVPAFDALDPDDVVIVPGSALGIVAAGPTERAGLVDVLERARIAGLILVDAPGTPSGGGAGSTRWTANPARLAPVRGGGRPGPPPSGSRTIATPPGGPDLDLAALGREAERAGLPTISVRRGDPAAIERSVIGFLVNRRAELDRQAGVLESRLARLALGDGGLAALLGAVGAFLGRAAVLEARRGDLLLAHAPADLPEAASAIRRYHDQPRKVALRVPLPAGPGSEAASDGDDVDRDDGEVERRSAGYLALLGERPASELDRVVADRIAGLLALELARDEAVRRAGDAARRSERLPAAGPPWAVLVARQVGADVVETIDQREEARRGLRLLAPPDRLLLRGDANSLELRVVLAAGSDDPGALELASRLGTFLGRPVALSRAFESVAERSAAEADARATLEAVEALSSPPPVARADRLPAYRLLGGLYNLPDGRRQAEALLEPILRGRPDVRRERLATLRAVFDQPGLGEAAAALGIHRNTLAYRLRRIEALTGWRMADPELRLPLALAVRLVQSD